jgi:UDP-N-acetyl-D-galactosamine dehydrogenase
MIHAGISIKGAKINVLGLTFKENCPDLRNSKVADLIHELQEYGCEVFVHDPLAEPEEAEHEYGLTLTAWEALPKADVMVAAVSHQQYLSMPLENLLERLKPSGVFVDVKSAYPVKTLQAQGITLWRL